MSTLVHIFNSSIDELTIAISNEDMPGILACLNSQIPLDQKDICGNTPLTIATYSHNEEILRLLLMRGASVDYQDNVGWAPIHVAASTTNTEFLTILIKEKANIDIKSNSGGFTPLMLAASRPDSFDCVKLLLEHRASASMMDNSGRTALDMPAKDGTALMEERVSTMIKEAMEREKKEVDESSKQSSPKPF